MLGHNIRAKRLSDDEMTFDIDARKVGKRYNIYLNFELIFVLIDISF